MVTVGQRVMVEAINFYHMESRSHTSERLGANGYGDSNNVRGSPREMICPRALVRGG